MIIIKNSKELAKLVDENKDLLFPEDDIRIEFEPSRKELRNVYCKNLFLMNDDERFNFNGRNFYGWDFNGRNFNGNSFDGEHISYSGWFVAYRDIKCKSINGRRKNSFYKSLDGKLIIKEEKL